MESIWQRAFGQRMESICPEGICPEGFFWRAIVKEHLAEGNLLGEQVEPNHHSLHSLKNLSPRFFAC